MGCMAELRRYQVRWIRCRQSSWLMWSDHSRPDQTASSMKSSLGPSLGAPCLGASRGLSWEPAPGFLSSLSCNPALGGNLPATGTKGTAASAFKGGLAPSILVPAPLPRSPSVLLLCLSSCPASSSERAPSGEIVAGGRRGKKGSMRGVSAPMALPKGSLGRLPDWDELDKPLSGESMGKNCSY